MAQKAKKAIASDAEAMALCIPNLSICPISSQQCDGLQCNGDCNKLR